MADFIAVIRRAVDGLSDNTPEMRVRVYERARSAVQRQLDNMKPRPADDVIARQLEKLDEAIAAIEREFTGAPAAEPPAATPDAFEDAAPPPAPPAREPEPAPVLKPEPAPQVVAPEPVEPTPPPFLMREPAPVVAEPVEAKPEPVPAPKFEPAPQPKAEEPLPAPPEEAPSAAEDDTMPPAAAETERSWHRERFDEPLGGREPSRPADAPGSRRFNRHGHRSIGRLRSKGKTTASALKRRLPSPRQKRRRHPRPTSGHRWLPTTRSTSRQKSSRRRPNRMFLPDMTPFSASPSRNRRLTVSHGGTIVKLPNSRRRTQRRARRKLGQFRSLCW